MKRDKRLELHTLLVELLGSENVYYQAPESLKMHYPAIRYNRKKIDNRHADNGVYKQETLYEITVIDEDPESEVVERVSALPRCQMNRHFTSSGLNHDVFELYY